MSLSEFYITPKTPPSPEALGCFVRRPSLSGRGLLYDPISIEWKISTSAGVEVSRGDGVKYLDMRGVFFSGVDVEADLPIRETYSIEWTIDHGTQIEIFEIPFSVLGVSFELYRRSLVNPLRLEAEGIGADLDPSQWRRVADMVDGTVETMTGNVFRPVVDALTVRGGGTSTLFLDMPIIGLSHLVEQPTGNVYRDGLRVGWDGDAKGFFGQQYRNPSIKGRAFSPVEFYAHGVFGFTDSRGLPPPMVSEASYRLSLHAVDHIVQQVAGGGAPVVNAVRPAVIAEERVDRHAIKYDTGAKSVNAGTTTTNATLKTAEIEAILKQFRRPMRIRASSPRRF